MKHTSKRASAAAWRKVQAALPSAAAPQNGADFFPAYTLSTLLTDAGAAWQVPLVSETPAICRADPTDSQLPSKASRRRNRRSKNVGSNPRRQRVTDKGDQRHCFSPPEASPPAPSLPSAAAEVLKRSLSNLCLAELFAERVITPTSVTSELSNPPERASHSLDSSAAQRCQKTTSLSPMAPSFISTVCNQQRTCFHQPPQACTPPTLTQLSPGHSLPVSNTLTHSLSPLLVTLQRDSEKFLNSYLACDTQLSASLFKDMITTIRDSLLAGIDQLFSSLSSSVRVMEDRALLAELKLSEVINAHNALSETCRRIEEESNSLRNKIMALDDYNRRNNIKLRNIPESITNAELPTYVRKLLKHVLPTCSSHELTIDWVRRIPRPHHLPPTVHRDVVARVHFLHVKSAFLAATRRGERISEEFKDISVYTDLSPETLRHRRLFAKLTSSLRNNNIHYKWLPSARLLILHQNVKHIITNPEEGQRWMDSWTLA